MTYVVVSRRVGTPGDVFSPASEADAKRLLAGGFIAIADAASPKPAVKGRKVKTDPEETQEHGK